MIRPGELKERVVIQAPAENRNALGETTLSWSTYDTRWASVEGMSAREVLLNGKQDINITHRVKMRYVAGLNQNMRLSWRGKTLEIISILEHFSRSEHELICSETV
jgi:SPP1 family predicted phage head-tail adaptor